jgi:starvation-inducible outer membrane lipoprotein
MKVTTMRAIYFPMTCAVMLLNACSNYPSAIDDNFGASVRHLVNTQTAKPEAPARPTTQAQTDGQSVKSSIDSYQKSFEVLPPPANVFNIGVGSGTGGAAR